MPGEGEQHAGQGRKIMGEGPRGKTQRKREGHVRKKYEFFLVGIDSGLKLLIILMKGLRCLLPLRRTDCMIWGWK